MKKIHKKKILLALIPLYFTGCSMLDEKKSPSLTYDKDFKIKRYIDSRIKQDIDKDIITGASISLIKNNHVVHAKGFGYMDKSHSIKSTSKTLYRVASISKTFTSIAMMKLEDEKKLNIDVPINQYLPSFDFKNHPKNSKNVTIREVMTHHAGIPNVSSAYELSDKELNYTEVLKILKGEYLTAPVGTIYNYSNLGYALLGGVVENRIKTSFKRYMQKNILNPLDMKSSKFLKKYDFDKDRYQEVSLPTMGLVSNVIDLSKLIIAMNNNGKVKGDRNILSKHALNKMFNVQNKNHKLDVGKMVGLGLDIDIQTFGKEYPIYSRTGTLEEHRACIMFMPRKKLGVVILVNGPADIHYVKSLAHDTMIKLWENKTASKYIPKINRAFKTKSYEIVGNYNLNYFGAIEIFKNEDGLYKARQFASNETMELKKNIDNSYTFVDNSLHILSTDIFADKKLYFTRIENRDVIVLEDKYANRSIVGFKIKKSYLSHSWKNALGEYINHSVNMTLVLEIKNGYLQRIWKKNGNEVFSEFIKVMNDSEAIIDNLIAQSRVTLRMGLDKNGKFFVEHQGLSFMKRE